jgi:hypothetical protein
MHKSVFSKTTGAYWNANNATLAFSFYANVTSNTVYKIRGAKADTAGTGTATLWNESGFYSEFYAVRLP